MSSFPTLGFLQLGISAAHEYVGIRIFYSEMALVKSGCVILKLKKWHSTGITLYTTSPLEMAF